MSDRDFLEAIARILRRKYPGRRIRVLPPSPRRPNDRGVSDPTDPDTTGDRRSLRKPVR
jgi:hypothetical protein